MALWALLPIAVIILLMSAGFSGLNPKFLKNRYAGNVINIFDKTRAIFDEPHLDGPMPVYKNGSFEYIGDDYLVRPDAGVDQLLRKMLAFDVDPSGTITFQGQYITKAKLNGKYIGEGNLYNAIQRISASNIEKVVMVPEKNGQTTTIANQPTQTEYVLNLITYANKKAFMAAKRTIRGKVTDKQGAILIGATVKVAGAYGRWVETDANGNFKIDLPNRKDMLTADYVGHGHEHIKVGKQSKLNIILDTYKYRSKKDDPGVQQDQSIANSSCNENPKFKTKFFYNIHIIDKYNSERSSKLSHTITYAKFKNALLLLNKYTKTPIDKFLKEESYPDSGNFSNNKSVWVMWYDANKCNNLK